MLTENDEFSAAGIAEHQLVAWPRVAAVASMVAFSLPTFVTGLEVSHGLGATDAMIALIAGSLIIFVIGAIMGSVGAKTRLSSYLLVRIAFGDRGAGVVNLAFAVSLLGWFGVNINLFTNAVERLAQSLFGVSIGPLWLSIVASVCMTVTTMIGFRAINLVSTLLVPVLAVVTFLLAKSALDAQSMSEILATENTATLSVGDGVSAIVGAIIVGAIILPDITRFSRHWSGAVYTAIIAYVIIQVAVMGAASFAGIVSGKTDILEIMLDVNLGFGAFAIVIIGSWVLNSLNLYSAVLSTKATIPRLNTVGLTIGLGAVGVIAAMMNILDQFVTFLFYLSVIFIPVAGVIVMDFLVIRPARYHADTLIGNRPFSGKGFAAWALGAVVALLASEGIIPALTTIAAIDAMAVSAVVYTLISWRDRKATTS
ncbi:MAG: cytosine permease [Xanthomonadales bacterium]|nr:cytosine permease [Xanthomonadales bacterium]